MIISRRHFINSFKLFNSAGFSRCNKYYGYKFSVKLIHSGFDQTIEIREYKLRFQTVGNGPQPVVCMPGALGFIESDFSPLIGKLNREKLTVVAWDPPGCGKSRPPGRDYAGDNPVHTLSVDADLAHELMIKVGHHNYSVLGCGDGGISALLMANMYPTHTNRIIICAAKAFLTQKDREKYIYLRNVENSWPSETRGMLVNMYGEEYFKKTAVFWMDCFLELYDKDGDICKAILKTIACPTLIVHGALDELVNVDHANYLHKHIPNSKLLILPDGKHSFHLNSSNEFKTLAEGFILETERQQKTEPIFVLNSLIE